MVNIDIAAISGADAFAKTAKDGVTECIRLKKMFNEKDRVKAMSNSNSNTKKS